MAIPNSMSQEGKLPGVNSDCTVIIVPTYNERESLPILVDQIENHAPDCHLLIVDDNSPDGTADVADSLFADKHGASVLRRTGPRGLGLSYVDGYRQSLVLGYSRVVQMDADLSHDPRYIPELIHAAATADVVIGSRYCTGGGVAGWPMHRLLLSKFANIYVAAITGLRVRDATAGFRCYTRRALEAIDIERITSNGYAFQVEMVYRASQANLRIAEVPIVFTDRAHGQSKISRKVLLESMVVPWSLRFGSRRTKEFGTHRTPIKK